MFQRSPKQLSLVRSQPSPRSRSPSDSLIFSWNRKEKSHEKYKQTSCVTSFSLWQNPSHPHQHPHPNFQTPAQAVPSHQIHPPKTKKNLAIPRYLFQIPMKIPPNFTPSVPFCNPWWHTQQPWRLRYLTPCPEAVDEHHLLPSHEPSRNLTQTVGTVQPPEGSWGVWGLCALLWWCVFLNTFSSRNVDNRSYVMLCCLLFNTW